VALGYPQAHLRPANTAGRGIVTRLKHKRVIHPDSKGNRQHIWRWLLANGCRDVVALEPVTIHYTQRGKIIEYQALCRQGRLDDIRVKRGLPVTKRKRMWLRYELSEVE